jgi:hypothetical protein
MCLMLYVGTRTELPLLVDGDIRVEEVKQDRRAVRRWFSSPFVHFVGAHTGCSCGFPSVIAEAPIEYFDGLLPKADERPADLKSVQALIDLLRASPGEAEAIELYPVADGEEDLSPKGLIRMQLSSLDPERFFLNERFMHLVER